MRRRALSSILLTGVSLWMAPRRANACTCSGSTLLSPQAGSTGVPLNAAIVFYSVQSLITLVERERNLGVPITVEPFPGCGLVWVVRPNELLRPSTTYQMNAVPSLPGEMSTFTTGTSTDHEAPTYGGLTSFSAETSDPGHECLDSCRQTDSPIRRLKFDFPPPPADTSLLLLETRAPDATAVATIPIYRYLSSPDWPRSHTDGLCSLGASSYGPGETICARLVAVDMAGHRAEPSPEICTQSSACASPTSANFCVLSEECLPPDAGTADAGGPVNRETDATCDCSLASHASRPLARVSLLTVLATSAAFARRRRGAARARRSPGGP